MGGVYCPKCESSVEATAKFCLSCGNDFTTEGAITSTGHDLNQLKEVIRQRDDLSMAEKFDMIAKVEEGANPITLGIAAPAEGEEGEDLDLSLGGENEEEGGFLSKTQHSFGDSVAASAAVRAVTKATEAWKLIKDGKLDLSDQMFKDAMQLGMDASTHIHDVASGEHEGIDPDAMRAIPVLKPPKRSFCPKCGSDIHANTMLQWRKWRDGSGDVVSMQLEASMEAALIQIAAHYVNAAEKLEKKLKKVKKDYDAARKKLGKMDKKELTKNIEDELRPQIEEQLREELGAEIVEGAKGRTAARSGAKASASKQSTKPKKKSAGMFGGSGKKSTKTFDGKIEDKPEWFLSDALDTIYDPHGTGKKLKRKTILARSSEGNVRVEDVVMIYTSQGEKGLSELAWTSPITKYIIEAYDSC